MSTGKIGRTLNPRSKVTPGFTQTPEKQEVKRHELLEKVDEVIVIIKEEFQPLLEVLEQQNKLFSKLMSKVDLLDQKINDLQKENKDLKLKLNSIETKSEIIRSNSEIIIENSNKNLEEDKKGWFK